MSQKKVKKPSSEPSMLNKSYLFLYNSVQTVGWSYILYKLINYYTFGGPEVKGQTLWEYIKLPVIIFQNAAVIEILNASLGIVKSNPVITTIQVLSRVMVVCGVVIATPDGKVSPGLPLALLAWSITEIIRYAYYTLNLIDKVPFVLIYLRYTTFIALYPIGVTGELLCFYWAQHYAKNNTVWSIEMPNKWNATFSYFYLLWAVMISYLPTFPQMYLHMFAQRKKLLGNSNGSSTAATQKQKAH